MELSLNRNPHNAFAYFFSPHGEICYFLYALSKRMEEGHICLPIDQLPEADDFWKDFSLGKPNNTLTFPLDSEFASYEEGHIQKPFTLRNQLLYLSRYYFYETQIANKLIALATTDAGVNDKRKSELKSIVEFVTKLQSNDVDVSSFSEDVRPDWQLVASIQGFLNNVTIITGGPGTGKTTTVAKILALLYATNPHIKVALAAPTGKAAVRMKESLTNSVSNNANLNIENLVETLNPLTIHRLLKRKGLASRFFKADQENTLDFDVVIIDESSMIGAALFAKLLSAIGGNTRLILLGDSDQLASVDSGSIFGDLCDALSLNSNQFSDDSREFINLFMATKRTISNKKPAPAISSPLDEHLIRLKKTYRYDPNSKMGRFTQTVIAGDTDSIIPIIQLQDDTLLIDNTYSSSIFDEFVSGYADYINESDIQKALNQFNNRRVLCAVRESKHGIYKTNQRIEAILKKHLHSSFAPGKDFYTHQPILITKNRYDIGLANGDIGIVRNSEWHQNQPMVFFSAGGKEEHGALLDKSGNFIHLKAINPGFISDWETAFAITIHKSQGSEFDNVFVILPENSESKILTRELLYTAVSRAKKGGKAIIQGNIDTIKIITSRSVGRISGIKNRILNK